MKLIKEGGKGSASFERPKTKAPTPASQTAALKVGKKELSLPTEMSEPARELGDTSLLLYGEKKIGKTSFASKFPEAIFFFFEPGGKGLRVYGQDVTRWQDFVGYVDLLVKSSRFKTVVIDTVGLAYDMCYDFICKREVVEHPNEGSFGDIWKKIEDEFVKQMKRLLQSGRGVIFLAHADVYEFQSRKGGTYHKLTPIMAKAARKFLTAVVDTTAYYGYYGDERFITLTGSDDLEAGTRLEENFRIKGSTRMVHSIPCGSSSQESYDNFVRAFHNLQEEENRPGDDTGLSDIRAPRTSGKKR